MRKEIKNAGYGVGSTVAIYERWEPNHSERHVTVDKDSEGFYYRVHGAPNGDLIFETDQGLELYLRGAAVAGFQQVV